MNKKITQKEKPTSLLRCLILLFVVSISFASLQAKSSSHLLYKTNTFTFNQTQTIPLQEAIDNLAKAYNVSIIYDVEQLEKVKVKGWKSSEKSIEVDLKKLLKDFDLSYKKLNDRTKKKTSSTSVAPPKSILKMLDAKGYILDNETKEALIGVNIIVKNSGEGTVTELDGSFSIRAEEGSALIISYLGYLTQEVKIEKADLGTIYLKTNSSQLDEVVVVGYGTQKRSDLTGALSSVSEKELKALPSTGLDQALQGRAAGVFVTQNSGAPGGGVSIRIRGIGSTLTAEPLYVIDGVPVVNDNQASSSNFSELDGGGQNSNALNTINPSDMGRHRRISKSGIIR